LSQRRSESESSRGFALTGEKFCCDANVGLPRHQNMVFFFALPMLNNSRIRL
jgi:hypothetical protein